MKTSEKQEIAESSSGTPIINNDKDPRGKKWQLTINNPIEQGFTHEVIVECLKELVLEYYCLADEIGLEGSTPHTHIYLSLHTNTRFSRLKKLFPTAHIERALGTSQQNRDYILKTGKYAGKGETSVEGSFLEWGTLPTERQGNRADMAVLVELIEEGVSKTEIISNNPNFLRYDRHIDSYRQEYLQEIYRKRDRELTVTYIWGHTGTGKTRGVMTAHDYDVYRVTDYTHPFDGYRQQEVIAFEEFNSSLQITEMLNYLDRYPCELPARYNNKTACYTTVYIISNIELRRQYSNVQFNNPEIWHSFLRRIHKIKAYHEDGTVEECTTEDYLNKATTSNDTDTFVEMENMNIFNIIDNKKDGKNK